MAFVSLLAYGNVVPGNGPVPSTSTALESDLPPQVDFSEIGSITAVVTLADIRQINNAYIFYDYQEVGAFLSLHPNLVGVLLDALPQIRKFFGRDTSISLRVSCDQESDPTLSANIQTTMEVSEARAARKSFNASWWMRLSAANQLPLTFNIEYV